MNSKLRLNKILYFVLVILLLTKSNALIARESISGTELKNQGKSVLFVGTYTRNEGFVDGKASGIYVYQFDNETGKLEYISTSPPTTNPSYLAVHPNKQFIYCVNETNGDENTPFGKVSSFGYNLKTNEIRYLNSVSSQGNNPCYISIDHTGKFAFAANYGGGNVALFRINDDGTLCEANSVIQQKGKGPTTRQESPHAHMIIPSADNQFVYAVDLGIDKIFAYKLDRETGSLVATDINTQVAPGSGPRQLAFHPHLDYAYAVCELKGTVQTFLVDKMSGALSNIQTISTMEEGNTGFAGSADIAITPSGRYLYASNRGDANNMAMYSIDYESGRLSLIGFQSTLGKTPRNFVIDPTGVFLLVANQDSGNVVTFRIDGETGKLIETGITTEIPTPVCLKFL